MKTYYIIDKTGKQAGPFPGESLMQQGVTAQTYVWCEGMGSNWTKAGEVDELKQLFNSGTPTQTFNVPGMNNAAPKPAQPSNSSAARQPQNPYAPAPASKLQPGTFNQPQPGAFNQPQPGGGAFSQQQQKPFGQSTPQQPYGGQQTPYGQPMQQPKPMANTPQQPYGQPMQQPYSQPGIEGKPDNYLVWAILSTILCCIPFGIVAIVYSTKVDNLWMMGNYQEAKANSDKAKMWSMIAAGSCITFVALYIILFFIAGISNY